jgi:hypothetical protein
MLALQIVSEPPGALVTIDGNRQALRTPSTFSVPRAPSLSVRVEKDGFRAHEERIQIPPGASEQSSLFTLEPIAAPAPAQLTVRTNAKHATWKLDGTSAGDGSGTLALPTIAPGHHKISVEARGFVTREQSLEIAPNQHSELEWTLQPTGGGAPAHERRSLSDQPNTKFSAPR